MKAKPRRLLECLSGILMMRENVRQSYWLMVSVGSSSHSAPMVRCWQAGAAWSICLHSQSRVSTAPARVMHLSAALQFFWEKDSPSARQFRGQIFMRDFQLLE